MPNDGAPGFPHFVDCGDNQPKPRGGYGGVYIGPCALPDRTLTEVKMQIPNRPEFTRRTDPSPWRCLNCRTCYAPHVDKCECCTLPVTK